MLMLFIGLCVILLAFDLTVLPRTKKTKISCRLELASVNSITGDILYTFIQVFPRIILAEINTHLVAGKNTASSRAIPTLKQLRRILLDPFVPYTFGTYKSGMQAGPEHSGLMKVLARQVWLMARWPALAFGLVMYCWPFRLAKQISNRIVEPWMWVEQIWTATDVVNERLQRNHKDAEPHYHELARQKSALIHTVQTWLEISQLDQDIDPLHSTMLDAYQREVFSRCQHLLPGQWHLPFVGLWKSLYDDLVVAPIIYMKVEELKQLSAGRCAWVSYYLPGAGSDKYSNEKAALKTYGRLAMSSPKHLSPLMHQATPIPRSVRVANLCGFLRFRKEISDESGGEKVVPSITPNDAQAQIWAYEQIRRREVTCQSSSNPPFVYDTMEA
jgi:hypothetical protein